MSATTVQYFRTKYAADPRFMNLFQDVPFNGITPLTIPTAKKKAQIGAEVSGQWCLRLRSNKLTEIK